MTGWLRRVYLDMKIAVLMSSYNGEKFIREQMESILSQNKRYETMDHQLDTFQLDVWVRDDGSEDHTISILQDYEKQNHIRWYQGENLGPAFSFLDLIKHCSGYDYYAFSDQDDVWKEDKLVRAIQQLQSAANGKEYPCLYLSNAELVNQDMVTCGRNVYKQNPKLDFETVACAGGLLGCTMVFNEALARLIREFDSPRNLIMHDFYTALVCTACGGTILYEECATMKYRQHQENVVGVAQGIIGKIKDRFQNIFYKNPVSIAQQAEEILRIYDNRLMPGAKEWLCKISHYRNNIFSRISLACSRKTKYINKNMGFTNRCAILFGSK